MLAYSKVDPKNIESFNPSFPCQDQAPPPVRQILDLLSGSPEKDIVASERILLTLGVQGRTIAGYPRLRPSDCALLTQALAKAVAANRALLVLGDPAPARRFEALIDAYAKTDVQFYPRELFRARLVQAEIKLLLNDFAGVRAAVGTYLDHPYSVEGGFSDLMELFRLGCLLRAAAQHPDEVGNWALNSTIVLVGLRPRAARQVLAAMSPFLGLGRPRENLGLLRRGLLWACRGALKARRDAGWRAWPLKVALTLFYGACAYLGLQAIRHARAFGRFHGAAARRPAVLSTRAMGGIGDLIMMTPGFRALAKDRGGPVRLAIPRKFFAIFENNPHVELLDIDATPLETGERVMWRNLTMCPAAAYESTQRPWVRKSRVELFARGLGVSRRRLARWGDRVELFLEPGQHAAAQLFLRTRGLGARPLVGVQPFSRDSYKDHPGIIAFIEDLARDYDVLVFHHTDAGLPSGPGIATTAGLPLSLSLALVSRLAAMVSCDSAFLHAAGAFEVPVFALFGPTDGALFTRHHRFATVYQNKTAFPCSPCWRNEDIPCKVTGRVGNSPCVAAIDLAPVRAALATTLAARVQKEGEATRSTRQGGVTRPSAP